MHIITSLTTGGAERACVNLLKGGLSCRYENSVVSLCSGGFFEDVVRKSGIDVFSLYMKKGVPNPSSFFRLYRLLDFWKPDILQGWMYHGNIVAWMGSVFTQGKSPCLAWNIRHCLDWFEGEKPLTRDIIRLNGILSNAPSHILHNSELSRSQHVAFGFRNETSIVIPNGFDTHVFYPDSQDSLRVRNELNLPLDAFVIGHIARVHPIKDHQLFMRAAISVAHRHKQVFFMIVGQGVENMFEDYRNQMPEEISKRFLLLGERHDIPRLMRALNLFVQSSRSEAFPNVLGEAMASGVPCLATDVGDSSRIIGDTGWVVPPSHDKAMVESLEDLLSMDTRNLSSFSVAARQRVKSHFSLSSIVDQYTAVYEDMTNNDLSISNGV